MKAHEPHKLSHDIKVLLVGVVLCVGLGNPEPAAAEPASWVRDSADNAETFFHGKAQAWLRPLSHPEMPATCSAPFVPAIRRAPMQLDPRIRGTIKQLLRTGRRGPTTFDGDGTLWAGDVGEGFFQWMLKNRYYPVERIPSLANAWQGYKAGTFPGEQMYELMVTGMAGMQETEVRELATRYFDAMHQQHIYRPMAHLVHTLDRLGMSPWVVSGSPYWVVAAGARHLGIPADRVIGLTVRVAPDGRLTDEVVRPVPWKDGKAKVIRSTVGTTPVLAAGNSYGDIAMLRTASEVPLVVNPTPDTLQQAQRNGWTVHHYSQADEISRRPLALPPAPERRMLPGPMPLTTTLP